MVTENDGVIGAPRMWEILRYDGKTVSRNRVARRLTGHGLYGRKLQRISSYGLVSCDLA